MEVFEVVQHGVVEAVEGGEFGVDEGELCSGC